MLSKTTLNYAKKRNLELCEDEDFLFIHESNDDSEPMIVYRVDGESFIYHSNIWLPASIKEELPYWIKNEKHLREILDFIANELAELS